MARRNSRSSIRRSHPALLCLTVLLATPVARAQALAHADILLSPRATPREHQAALMLSEEIRTRTSLNLPVTDPASTHASAHILLAQRTQASQLLAQLHLPSPSFPSAAKPESFSLRTLHHGSVVLVAGSDERGVLFGAGYLLRHLDMTPHTLAPHDLADIDTAPAFSVRGHQLGYRPKNNTFDGWSAAQFEQYIRDLAVFGTNTIEIIPPRSDDDAQSPLFTLPPMQMMVQLSSILDRYGLDCSIWYPALDKDYSNPAAVDAAVNEWGAVFDQLPRIDAVFVPGGDPGHTEPKFLFHLLEREAARLRVKHPQAQMWVSPQSFSAAWLEEFYSLLAQRPPWLTGVVYGPEMRDTPEQFRQRVPAGIPIRFYPDITHTLSAQYPVPNWDPAFALTEGREPINPRPIDQGLIFHRYAPLTHGFVAYSEGSNDDVNKVLWSAWGWNPAATAPDILAQYGRYFLAPSAGPLVASAALGLEEDWRGPLLSNTAIHRTLATLQQIESTNPTAAKANWRLQQLLYRGAYDSLLQGRLRRETAAEAAALHLLETQPPTDTALQQARATIPKPVACADDPGCPRLQQLADDLFHSIRMQLSVPRYQALAVGRGANLDEVETPLTSAAFLDRQITLALATTSPAQRSAILQQTLVAAGHPSSTALFDDLGDPALQPHLVFTPTFAQDPSGLSRTYLGVDTGTRAAQLPLPWRTFAGTLYDRPLELQYTGLPASGITVHLTLLTDARKLTVLANGQTLPPACDEDRLCLHPTYTLPATLVAAGKLRLQLLPQLGLGGNGRYLQLSTVILTPNL